MQIGNLEIMTISGGRFRTDGGSMFGVVPRPLWVRSFPTDEMNRIPQETHCIVVRTGGQTVLIDTGYGSKLPPKERTIIDAQPGDPLVENLQARGIAVDDVDTVILSHLHFDHAGGGIQRDADGSLVPTFPNAEYVVQRLEWETATSGRPEFKNAYPLDNILPLQDSGRLRFIDGDVEIVPGIRGVITGGHTQAHMALYIGSGDQTAVFVCDICPTWRHLPALWCMSYDVDLLQTRRIKPRILGEIADRGWLAITSHDPDHAAVRIARDDRREFIVTEAFREIGGLGA